MYTCNVCDRLWKGCNCTENVKQAEEEWGWCFGGIIHHGLELNAYSMFISWAEFLWTSVCLYLNGFTSIKPSYPSPNDQGISMIWDHWVQHGSFVASRPVFRVLCWVNPCDAIFHFSIKVLLRHWNVLMLSCRQISVIQNHALMRSNLISIFMGFKQQWQGNAHHFFVFDRRDRFFRDSSHS